MASQSAEALALAALGWILQEGDRAQRFLELTGLQPEDLRAGIGSQSTQIAILEFLENHEPDMLRAAEALAITPEELVAAKEELQR